MSTTAAATIVWFRQDLRLHDHPAMYAAVARARPLLALYIVEPTDTWSPGAASRYWLQQSLAALSARLAQLGQTLILRQGDACEVLAALVADSSADALYFNRRYEPAGLAVDQQIERTLTARAKVRIFTAHVLFEPSTVMTASATPFRVYTPFYRACLRQPPPVPPVAAPLRLPPPVLNVTSLPLSALALVPSVDWAAGIRARWRFGEIAAQSRLRYFIERQLIAYPAARDWPAQAATAELSPYLHFGEISVREVWQTLAAAAPDASIAVESWRRQLLWREFAHHLLYHFPHTATTPFRPEYADFPWIDDVRVLARWQRGQTGLPLIDAGMRELWASGYMHNRVRMVVASFLCKHLGQHWLGGARWFWDTLVDADLANNTLGWQWSAGCGADAAPYFRIFNPLSQSRRFDPDGAYIQRWVPERAHLRGAAIHDPGIAVPGYPPPVIDVAAGRTAALARYAALRR